MTETKTVLKLFDEPRLNDIGLELLELDDEYSQHLRKIKENLYGAMRIRWLYGKIISENIDLIKKECGTQKDFANRIGKSPGVVSNNKRGYEALLNEGCETWEEVLELLKFKKIKPTVKSFEKIGKLLNEPDEQTNRKEQVDKDRRRLEELRGEAEEILRRLEPGQKPDLLEDAFEFVEDLEEIKEYTDSFIPENSRWRSKKYLDFVRNFGWDTITGEQQERCDPHHTLPNGSTGPYGETVADFWAIPVSRTTHNKAHAGDIKLSEIEILKAQVRTLSSFITLNLK